MKIENACDRYRKGSQKLQKSMFGLLDRSKKINTIAMEQVRAANEQSRKQRFRDIGRGFASGVGVAALAFLIFEVAK